MVKTTSPSPYCFLSGQSNSTSALSPSNNYVLLIRQQPETAKVCGIKERDRRPIDPPPIVQIKLANASSDRHKDYLQSPYLFMCCNLVHASDPHGDIVAPAHRALAGTVVSSLNRLKDIDNSDGGFFVFGDISVRVEGHFILRFSLFELLTKGQVVHIVSTLSNPLTVYSSKTFPGMSESTFLSRSFSDQGVRIRIRKDHHHHIKSRRALASVGSFSDSSNRVSAMHNPPSLSSHEVDRSDYDTKGNNVSRKSRPKTKKKNNTACSVSRIRASSAQQPYYKPVAIAARPSSANAQPRHHGSHESTEHTTSPSTPRYFNINSQNPYPFPIIALYTVLA
ncbi:hypothetical protein BG004_002837 [Podila humilis]|nr:hypothetical protein BG004_002837 [Podila humilis]